ncbi:dipeptide/oligopeptide/nickel ABC transporter permease/ATP-binding protein [Nocardioides deserti]|uniref:Dipeptide/oligopeptide/nickel ABC transporter permease/ATP-binding protein n=1 Tax=Nocardioides deserti TaxID=1588644 RepID=A0ABR6U4S7_9ACTN|nr:dipeptide/oligopeptide/nickel ABC transporter permease/ATP-binding protein [Nocardioides deserti]MBC2959305.1 dipeptide/oligopeptide/nickel ABC transporter permease/ATP-binding protein [Nocardioides deserti]GGO68093.1 ABC transporter [Nocardioides deserti]
MRTLDPATLAATLSRPGVAFRRLGPASRVALCFVVLIVLVGLLGPLLLTHDPGRTGLATPTTGPSREYWFGVDKLGRDVFSRLLSGTRRSLQVGFGAAGIALVLGGFLGALAGTARSVVDEVVMRCLDVVMAFPAIVLSALLIVSFGKNNLTVLILAIGFVFTPPVARIVRANVLSQYGEDYVAAERIIGARRPHILWRHVLRNCAAPILVYVTVMVADAIVFEASLSFIGGGLSPQEAASSWGSVIAFGKEMIQFGGWWATFFPGLLILLTVLALNVLSEGISDAWAAPAARRGTQVAPAGDRLEVAAPGSGVAVDLPRLAEAARRLGARSRPVPAGDPILVLDDVSIAFARAHGGVDVVRGMSFDVRPGEVLGLVGESGSGKSLTTLAVMGLLPAGSRLRGSIRFDGREIAALSPTKRRPLLGRDIAMIYQDALSALNPSLKIGVQLHQLVKRGGRRSAEELMQLVGLDPARTLAAYPHELSGGQRQRVVIAMALSRDPRLVIADEPTTALDVTVQAQVMELLLRLQDELNFALILVSHDLALVSDVAHRVVVMYGGQVVESGPTAAVIGAPAHHYARGLLGSVLSLETGAERLTQIPGVVPSPADFPRGCRFSDRCPMATTVCHDVAPALEGGAGHRFACHHPVLVPTLTEVAR